MNDLDIDWDTAPTSREALRPSAIKHERALDAEVTKILGMPVLVNDPRLIRLVVQWKKAHGSSPEIDKMDNFLYNPEFLVELRKVFGRVV